MSVDPPWVRRFMGIADDLWQRGDKTTSSEIHAALTQARREVGPSEAAFDEECCQCKICRFVRWIRWGS